MQEIQTQIQLESDRQRWDLVFEETEGAEAARPNDDLFAVVCPTEEVLAATRKYLIANQIIHKVSLRLV